MGHMRTKHLPDDPEATRVRLHERDRETVERLYKLALEHPGLIVPSSARVSLQQKTSIALGYAAILADRTT